MPRIQFRTLQWGFPMAVALHNGEEAPTLPGCVSTHSTQLILRPGAVRIWVGLLVLTVAAIVVAFGSVRTGKESVWSYLLFGYAAAMLVNVFVPHVPAMMITRAYVPGGLSAVLINLPLMGLLMRQALQEHWVSGKKAGLCGVLVPAALGAGIALWFGVR